MLNGTFRYCGHLRCFNPVIAAESDESNFEEPRQEEPRRSRWLRSLRNYSNKGSCCKDIAQTQGKRVEPWPKSDPPPPAWRPECPSEPQPPNYDPYRIKVPDVVCPPLPPSNAKWTGVLWQTSQSGQPGHQQGYGPYHNYPNQNPHATEEQSEEEAPPSTGFFGFLKGLFRGKGKSKGEGEVSMVAERNNYSQHGTSSDPNEHNTSAVFGNAMNPMLDLFHNSPIIHPDYWRENKKLPSAPNDIKDPLPRLGYHGKNKYKYAFHEPWKPLDRLTLLSQAEKEELEGQSEELGQIDAAPGTEKC